MKKPNLKQEFLSYMRNYYGATGTQGTQSLPPLRAGSSFPAFGQDARVGMQQLGGMNMGMSGRSTQSRLAIQSAQRVLLGE